MRTISDVLVLRYTRVVVLAAVLIACTVRSGSGDWPMWGFDAQRSGASPAALDLPETLHLQWMRELDPPRRAWPAQPDDGDKLEFDLSYAPVVHDATVFVGSMVSDRLTAYRLADGEELWRFYAGGPIRLAPAAWEGKVFFGSDDGNFYCLDAATGALIWDFAAAPSGHRVLGNARVISMWPVRGGPLVKDGTVYFAAGVWPFLGTMLYALDANTGAQVWANTAHADEWQAQPHMGAYAFAGLAPQGYLAASGDRLVVSGGRGYPALFERSSGRLLVNPGRGFVEASFLSPADVKGDGGYRVRIQDAYYYNHGRRYRLSDGFSFGSGAPEAPAVTVLRERVDSVSDQLDAPVFESLVASEKLLIVTLTGRLYSFGARPVPEPAQLKAESHPLIPKDTRTGLLADAIIAGTGMNDGYALVLGAGDGDLLEQLAVRSQWQLIAFEPDPERAQALRRRLDDAGLYGTRAAVLAGDFGNEHYPAYISALIVAVDPAAAGLAPDAHTLQRVYAHLRPYTGQAWLGFDPADRAVQSALADFAPANGTVSTEDGRVMLAREGPLPGAGRWTHQYGDATQSVMSGDELVRPPFGPLWFGGISNANVLPRHGNGPTPQVTGGRLFVLGFQTLSARCVFTGRELWVRDFPGIGYPFTFPHYEAAWEPGTPAPSPDAPSEPGQALPEWRYWGAGGIGAHYLGSPFVSVDDAVYVRRHRQVHRLDPETGASVSVFELPGGSASEPLADWGHLSVMQDWLVTTDQALGYSREATDRRAWVPVSSRRLHVFDRHSGRLQWSFEAETGIRHNAVVAGSGRIFLIDGVSSDERALLARRGLTPEPGAVIAFEIATGKEVWRLSESVFGTWLGYSETYDVLIQAGRRGVAGGRDLRDEPSDRIVALRGADGSVLWDREYAHTGPLVINDRRLIPGPATRREGPPGMLDVLTGSEFFLQHPLTGAEIPWAHARMYGCDTYNAAQHLATFRSGAAAYVDLEHGGVGTIGGFRSGCSHNLVAADGVLNAPDYTRTCTCSYQNQTSLGLIHMPEMDAWTVDELPPALGTIKRLGINLGAPGNRRDADGTLWIPLPRTTAPAPTVDMLLDTYDFEEPPVRMKAVHASENPDQANQSLDGKANTFWTINSDHAGRFGQSIQYDFSGVVTLDHVKMAWAGPLGTRFDIEVSHDGVTWSPVYANPPYAAETVLDLPLPEADWRFRVDPEDRGESEGWYDPDVDDRDWDTLSIGQSWTQYQAYARYAGAGWYRRSFELPERPGDVDPGEVDAVELVFGGVDETARVWVNGRYAGRHDIGPVGWDLPFVLWVGDLVRWGETNHIVVCARNTRRAGGIWRPVHLVAMRLRGDAGGDWRAQFEKAGRGGCKPRHAPATYAFEPVAARHLRMVFGTHEDFSEDPHGRRMRRVLEVSRVRIGGLAWPAAYSAFMPKNVFRRHTLLLDSNGGGLNWVGASGVRGVKTLRIGDIGGGGRSYAVSMHFFEPDDVQPGERSFDVRLQGHTVVRDLDLARQTGGARRAVAHEFGGITIDDALLLELAPASDSRLMPVLSGVSIVAE